MRLDNRSSSQALQLARNACHGDLAGVQSALEQGAAPNDVAAVYDTEGTPLFLTAACLGEFDEAVRVEIARALLDAGADIGAIGEFQFPDSVVPAPPHIAAAFTDKPRLLSFLLSRGASVNSGDVARGGGALLWAAESGCLECVSILQEAGADLEQRNNMGLTALFIAAVRGDEKMTERLLEAGANPFVEESTGRSALGAAGSPVARELLRSARNRIIAMYVIWSGGLVLLLCLALYYWLRREEPADA